MNTVKGGISLLFSPPLLEKKVEKKVFTKSVTLSSTFPPFPVPFFHLLFSLQPPFFNFMFLGGGCSNVYADQEML